MKALTEEQQAAVAAWLAARWRRCPYCEAGAGWDTGEKLLLPVGAGRQAGPSVNVSRAVIPATCRACAAVGLLDAAAVLGAGG